MKFVGNLLISLLVAIIFIAGLSVGGYYYVKDTYGIDIIKTVDELVILNLICLLNLNPKM